MVRPEGLEPSTIDVEDRYSIQLSYGRLNQRLALREVERSIMGCPWVACGVMVAASSPESPSSFRAG